MDEIKYVFYNVTCHTVDCEANNVKVRGLGPENTVFMCGTCGVNIDDVVLCEDQDTKDGCIEFCPDSANHKNWVQCYNSMLKRLNPAPVVDSPTLPEVVSEVTNPVQ